MLPTLNILLYTDYPTFFHENPLDPEGGLTDLEAFIAEKTKPFVKVKFKLVNRHGADAVTGVELHGEKMITDELLSEADELWVLGRRMATTSEQPHNELEANEIEILERHMRSPRRMGVFVTGDHSQSPDELACKESNHQEYLSLGRALGIRIPIAGLLRDWEGPPTRCIEGLLAARDNFNTQEGFPPEQLDEERHESDSTPQTILPNPTAPHPLFTYVNSNNELRQIDKLPDHIHEGRVLGPEDVAGNWPEGLPSPVVAARGKDKRFPTEERIFNLVVTFDGDPVERGRIVVDSSFHHYLNYNLKNILSRNPVSNLPEPDTPLDQIAHFFGNLALWLAPKHIREKIGFDIILSLARHTTVLEATNLSDERLGSVTRHVLNTTIGAARVQWLLGRSSTEERNAVNEFFSLLFASDEDEFKFGEIMTPNQLLGTTVRICDHLLTEQRIADVTRITQHQDLWQPVWANLLIALEAARTDFIQRRDSESVNKLSANELKGEEEMEFRCKHRWRSFVNEERDGILRVDEIDDHGNMKGQHERGVGPVNFTGKCEHTPHHHIEIETVDHIVYRGRIYTAGDERFAVGTRTSFTVDKDGKRKKLNGDEVWVGTKIGE